MNILKETGIIRKVDELGRIVLPKEIRKTLGIKDGEDLEIYIKDKAIYLQKYSRLWALKDISEILIQYALEEMNLNIASSYLVMAAELLEIKALMLLPKDEEIVEENEICDDDIRQEINESEAEEKAEVDIGGIE